jgi:hypothetical protein
MLGLGGGPVRDGDGGLWLPAHPASAIAADTINAEARADSQAIRRSPTKISLCRAPLGAQAAMRLLVREPHPPIIMAKQLKFANTSLA